MKRPTGVLLLLLLAAGGVAAQYSYPDLIRMKDGETVRCYIASESEKEVVVEFADAPHVTVTVERDHVEWLWRAPRPKKKRLGERLDGEGSAAAPVP